MNAAAYHELRELMLDCGAEIIPSRSVRFLGPIEGTWLFTYDHTTAGRDSDIIRGDAVYPYEFARQQRDPVSLGYTDDATRMIRLWRSLRTAVEAHGLSVSYTAHVVELYELAHMMDGFMPEGEAPYDFEACCEIVRLLPDAKLLSALVSYQGVTLTDLREYQDVLHTYDATILCELVGERGATLAELRAYAHVPLTYLREIFATASQVVSA